MSDRPDRLFNLLPAIYQLRDHEQGGPLRALLSVIDEQADVVERDIDRLYRNWFIETCEEWAVPYLGDLIGYVPLHPVVRSATLDPQSLQQLSRIETPRREVANTVRYRRRKGTRQILEQLARDVAGWEAIAFEFRDRVAQTQALRHPRPALRGTSDVRRLDADLLDGPFDPSPRTAELRRLRSSATPGRYSPWSVGVFVFPWRTLSVTRCQAFCRQDRGPHCYTFSALGGDTPLFHHPRPDLDADAAFGPHVAPLPISRRAMQRDPARYYGPGRSIEIWRRDGGPGNHRMIAVEREQVVVADLSGWACKLAPDQVAVDPERGRILFHHKEYPEAGVRVSYWYAQTDALGGGEYERPLIEPTDAHVYRVVRKARGQPSAYSNLGAALRQYRQDQNQAGSHPRPETLVEIERGGVFPIRHFQIDVPAHQRLVIRAGQRVRPIIYPDDLCIHTPDALVIRGASGSRLELDGLVFYNRQVRLEGAFEEVALRHVTLVAAPAPSHCAKTGPALVLALSGPQARVVVQHSILGPCRIDRDGVGLEPLLLEISDSILDGRGKADSPGCALAADTGGHAHAALTLLRSTVLGSCAVHAVSLAENSLCWGRVQVARRQTGCLRFCYVPSDSRTPRRYRCVPDRRQYDAGNPPGVPAPIFVSATYGHPGYARLAPDCPAAIRRGADDESEMGVFHDVFLPQRLQNLSMRLDEFTPARFEAGVLPAPDRPLGERKVHP